MSPPLPPSLTKSPLRALLTLAAPIILANVLQAGYQLTDSFWVGRISGDALAAVSLCTPIIFLTIALGTGFAVAGSAFVAQYFGARNDQMVSRAAAQTLLMVLVTSSFLSTIGYFASPSILAWMGVPENLVGMAESFLKLAFIGMVANFTFFMFQSIMRGVGRTGLPLWIIFGTVLINIALDPFFIFTMEMGVAGAALATIVTQTAAALIGLWVLLAGKHGIRIRWSDFRPDFVFIRRAFWMGLPSSIEQSSRGLGMTTLTALVTSFGATAVAAYGVGGNIFLLVMFTSMSIAMANSTLVGHALGAGDPARAVAVARLAIKLSFIVLALLGGVVWLSAPWIIALFVPGETTVIAAGAEFLRFIAPSFPLVAMQMTLSMVFIAAGQTRLSMMITIASQWACQIPLAYLLAYFFDIQGVWLAFGLAYAFSLPVVFVLFFRGSWQHGRLTAEKREQRDISKEILKEEGIPL